MSWVEDGRALRRLAPSAEGLARLGAALGEHVSAGEPLLGGVAASAWTISTPTRHLVLKRYRRDDDTSPMEWERLHLAAVAPVPTPEPVAFDPDGAWFGTPALVMTLLPGRSMYPPDPEALGRALAALHSTPLPEPLPPMLERPGIWETWEPQVEYPTGALDAIARLQQVARELPRVLCHCDFHPGNVLVVDGVVSGVVDWSGARAAPSGFDIGLARCDLAIEPGGDAPSRLLAAYEAAAGTTVAHVGLWDVLAAARALEWGDGWVDAWTEVGVPMTEERIRTRATEFAVAALS